MLEYPGVQNQRGYYTDNGSIKMRIVIDAITGIFGCPGTIEQEKDAKQPGGHGNDHEDAQHGFGLEKYVGKQNGTDCPRGSQATIIYIVLLLEYCRYIAQYQAQNIDERKLQVTPGTDTDQHGFEGKTKEV